MISTRISPIALAVSSAIVLTACGGGGGGSSSSGTSAPASTSITVTPSLGKFSTACNVEVRKSTGELLGSAPVASNGTAAVSIPGDYSGAIIAQVKGAAGCTYFDEAAGETPFGDGKQLSAVVDDVRSLGINALTNLSAARLLDGNKLAAGKTSDHIKTENATVQLMFQVGDMFAAPTLIGKSTDTIDNTEAGKLAAKLAALAEIAKNLSKNVATLAADLAEDLKDGTLDGIESAQFQAALTAAVNAFADSTSKSALLDLPANTSLRTRTSDVETDAAKVLAAGDDLKQAKEIFADLRTSIMSISNEAGTGSLDMQTAIVQEDLLNGADFSQFIRNLSLMSELASSDWPGSSSSNGSECHVVSTAMVQCGLYDRDKGNLYTVIVRPTTQTDTLYWLAVSVLELSTGKVTNLPTTPTPGATPVQDGMITVNDSGGVRIVGKLYPMAGDADYTAVNVTLTHNNTPGSQTYNGSGTLNALKKDGTTSAMKVDIAEVSISEANKTAKLVASLVSPRVRFDGTLEASGETVSKDGQSSPKDAKFVGSFTNTVTGFKFLEGTLTGSLDQSGFDNMLDRSDINFDPSTFSFKGTAYKSANVLGVSLDLTVSNSSYSRRTTNFSFTGSNNKAITGTGTQIRTVDGERPSTWTLANSSGITATYDSVTKSGKVQRADRTLGTISSQRVTFIDGTFESLL